MGQFIDRHFGKIWFAEGVICLAVLVLASCADNPKPGPIAQPAPRAVDPRLCADLEPEPAVQGSLVQPVTAEEQEAVQRFLEAELDVRSWGLRGWQRADIAKTTLCP